ncbi:hypothetical protein LC2W_2847 [Lacticaseibacillus paracasei]|uniref:Uncharacterized protein n=1 Tax=Lacticaseibacillus paracasei subsp. paracasei Lpp225 TaxID=1256225 RepID=S2NGL6_LACPA|nr:hypothetical protein LCAZH_2656 [Lacticaseibacillus paracasei]EPC22284.1 hypothetical protein Lpp226_0533 [Lacticaseibacillus paracasei subsp. paracasei Lpp226]EPC39010.1 hypothetical protein Lpp225_0481 [Lacticaseibacillus paracasei subsp. paracasei Lpp225]AEA55176.1 hypothetical protein LC2W_2847 [Lacticaseibacillus paracasei]AEA58367.1 hypothetical protein LCBD_2873 [Lacticaseibacillus paracasei]
MNNNQKRPLDFSQKSSDGLFDCQELREQGSPLIFVLVVLCWFFVLK